MGKTRTAYCSPGGVIHWTGNIGRGANAWANRNYFDSLRDTYASAHTVGDDTTILAALPCLNEEVEMAYHVGAASYRTSYFGTYPNACTLGHEMCVNADGNFRESYKRAVWVMANWCFQFGWDADSAVMRHYDVTGKPCPLPFTDVVHDNRQCAALGFTEAQTAWIRDHLHIDGLLGEALWRAYKSDVADLTVILREGGLTMLQQLVQKMEELQARNSELENRFHQLEKALYLSQIPDWAADSVQCAVQKGLIDTPEGGSYDFYRTLTILHRNGTL